MPIYQYKCNKCSACFEIKQSFNDKPYAVCHVCGGEARRMFVPVPIVFKGHGFYVTDHAAHNSNNVVTDKDSNSASSPKESKEKESKETDKNTASGKDSDKKNDEGARS